MQVATPMLGHPALGSPTIRPLLRRGSQRLHVAPGNLLGCFFRPHSILGRMSIPRALALAARQVIRGKLASGSRARCFVGHYGDLIPVCLPVNAWTTMNRDGTGTPEEQPSARNGSLRLQRFDKPPAHRYVAEQIKREIGLHLIAPGESLPPERELAEILGVSRKTVRQAVAELVADGLVETRRGRGGGTFVLGSDYPNESSEQRIERVRFQRPLLAEALTFRLGLEPLAAQAAALARSSEDLERIVRAAEATTRAQDHAAFVESDVGFHLAIARATQNRFFLAGVEEVLLILGDMLAVLPESEVWHERSFKEYGPIVGAIEVRDGESAREAMHVHIVGNDRSMRFFLAAL